MSIIDRYVIRQVLVPLGIGLLMFTFLLILPLLIDYAETFIAKGVPAIVVMQLMLTLVPYGLSLTIPMSLLLGLLVAFGRLSADREFVAMQACGVSLTRLLRPVGLVSVLCWAATSYVLLEAQPWGNRTFVERRNAILAERAEGEVKAHAFASFPDLTLYVRDVPADGSGWNGVFMHESRPGQPQSIYLAQHGHVVINREKKTVEMVMENGVQHTADPTGEYKVLRFARAVLTLDPEKFLPRLGPASLGANEMTIPQLKERIAELENNGVSAHTQRIALQHKFAIPIACLVFAVLGLALGATHRRDGSLGSFVLGLIVVFVYYIPLYLGPQMAKGGLVRPWVAAWLPNMILGALAAALFIWRDRVADRAITMTLPAFLKRRTRRAGVTHDAAPPVRAAASTGFPRILDRYVTMTYLRILGIAALAMLGIFYISTFIDVSDKVFKGQATWGMLGEFFWYSTPQYVYFVIPLSVLLSALITVGSLTKNSELIVMKACGISLYRIARPMVVCALASAGILFSLEQTILGAANRRAAEIRYVMNGAAPESFNVLTRQWMSGSRGEIYHYVQFDPRTHEMAKLEVFEFSENMRTLTRRTLADRATAVGDSDRWTLHGGWTRGFDKDGQPLLNTYVPFTEQEARLEPPVYFGTEEPEPKFMTFTQLREYTDRLKLTGFDVTEQYVAMARKVAFPFVTLVMTLIAIPFGVTTGRGGAMAGIGVGIALALIYWTAISVFAALGAGGVLPPNLAAWAPNLLFGAAAAYLLLTVRT